MATILSIVLTNLSTIISEEIELLGGLVGELQSIKDELQQMMDFLEGAEMLVQEYPDIRSWVGQVRDVAYDVEDVLDEFIMSCSYRPSTRRYGVLKKLYTESVGAIKARHELANRIQEIKKRIIDIADTHGRYKTQYQYSYPEHGSSKFSRVNNMLYDKRADALFLEEADLVGVEKPKIELTRLLLNGDGRRNVISVVGMGGLGKTTLVKNLYNDVSVKRQFSHHAWITVSETFKLEELFKDAIKQLFKEESQQLPIDLDVMDINRLKLVIKDSVKTKKYIVVFDDLWQLTHWDAIHLAFPRNQFGSRVVITTRNHELQAASMGESGGSVYRLSHLSNEKAMQLLCRKAFSGGTCPQHLTQICKKILSACEGLPLAIQVIGSILNTRSQRTEDWELFHKGLGVEMKRNSQLDAMTKLLSLSYHDLPLHLKNCMLYLSIFPEDSRIDKMRLSRLWMGEGFVEAIDGMTQEQVADSYLKELVDRCLVQVAHTDHKGSIVAIRVHDIIRQIIILKASEQNITTIFRGQGKIFQNNVRRLSVHGSASGNFEQAQNYCKSIRTIVLCKDVGGHISEPILSSLLSHGRRLVKVLDLEAAAQLERIPDAVFKLFHLKYLNLSYTNVKIVPKSVGMLQSLQSLNLLGTYVSELPLEIQMLQHLQHLMVGRINQEPFLPTTKAVQGVKVSFRIGNLESLEQLLHIEADQVDNVRVVTEIGKLLKLRSLRITKLKAEDGKELCSSLGNLTELRKLYVYSLNEEEVIDFQHFKFEDLPRLDLLILVGRLKKFPKLISSLHGLTKIELQYSKLSDDPVECLQDLPNLLTLNLTSTYIGESMCFKAGGFPKLKQLRLFFFRELRWMKVERNALPSLQHLWMRVCQSMEEIPTGIENLLLLQELEFSNMSNGFVNKLENLEKRSAAYKKLLQIPRVVCATYSYSRGRWSEVRYLNKETGTFNNVVLSFSPFL